MTGRKARGWIYALGLAGLAGAMLLACNTDPGTRQQTYLRLTLNDSLSRYDKIRIFVMDMQDTSKVLETVWSRPLAPGEQIPDYAFTKAEGRDFYVKIQGLVADQVVLETQIYTKKDGSDSVVHKDREPPTPSNQLSRLFTSTGATLEPAFKPETLDYQVKMAEGIATVTLEMEAVNVKAMIAVDGSAGKAGSASKVCTVGTAPDTVHIAVTDWGVTRTYRAVITPPVKAKLQLVQLTFSSGTLDPPFNPEIADYQLNVPTAIDSVTATLVPSDPQNTILTVLGVRAFSGQPSQAIKLNAPGTSKGITMFLQRGSENKSYTVIAIRVP